MGWNNPHMQKQYIPRLHNQTGTLRWNRRMLFTKCVTPFVIHRFCLLTQTFRKMLIKKKEGIITVRDWAVTHHKIIHVLPAGFHEQATHFLWSEWKFPHQSPHPESGMTCWNSICTTTQHKVWQVSKLKLSFCHWPSWYSLQTNLPNTNNNLWEHCYSHFFLI